ncbi:hypothetical protein Cfla_2432 [Cellulomonas flavigena DSM 20109]|uniref:Uncharacterized protein n=1 Tax=Cellulomonas flavigena (strain ATCC 482 / DSM 20109 / BCRC 11376 / JCM 18109 / NBRC 3775 / NCIMB 8073 / NRS 134) TaxID=446466 RepID=D5UHK1_CELFN|nr:hypothetical protein [Cellulomonas flavigena]ADG75322.1 hypothetical protein Cfla_2432 [Cellulomonas flavigena DSM 20109]
MTSRSGTRDGRTTPARYFALCNPEGSDRLDVPALLRRAADVMETLGPVDVVSVVLSHEFEPDGNLYPSITVVYDDEEDP